MASTDSLCDYPGCGTKLKPLFTSLYCPKEDRHGKSWQDTLDEYNKVIGDAQNLMAKPRIFSPGPVYGIPAFLPHTAPAAPAASPSAPPCFHPTYTITPGTPKLYQCHLCGLFSTVPFP